MRYVILLAFLSTSASACELHMGSDWQEAVLEAIDNVKSAKPAQAETDVQGAILEACEFWK